MAHFAFFAAGGLEPCILNTSTILGRGCTGFHVNPMARMIVIYTCIHTCAHMNLECLECLLKKLAFSVGRRGLEYFQ